MRIKAPASLEALRRLLTKCRFLVLILFFSIHPLEGVRAAEKNCATLLSKATEHLHSRSSSLNFFKSQISKNYALNNEAWFKEHAADSFGRTVNEKINWQRYHEEGLKPGENIIWIQQGMLKELNDKLWDIGGTEYYLLNLDRSLAEVLKSNPQYGRIIHRNYKDRVIISNLSAEEFQKQVMPKVRQRLVTEISQVQTSAGAGLEWSTYIRNSLNIGDGKSLSDAHFNLQLGKVGQNFDSWKSEVTGLRAKLELNLSSKGLSFGEALRRSRLYGSDTEAFRAWMRSKGFPSKTADRIKYYARLTNIADFLPTAEVLSDADYKFLLKAKEVFENDTSKILPELPRFKTMFRDSWDFRRAAFVRDLKESHVVLATDIAGLGEKALLARDKWIASGANKGNIESVYNSTTEYLDGYYKSLHDGLAQIVGGADKVKLYASGDDALWGLPKLTIEQHQAVEELLSSKKDLYHYSHRIQKPGDPESVADSIFGARDSLFALKPAVKQEKMDQ